MTREETIRHFQIPGEILELYHSLGLCGEVKKILGTWQYDDTDIERLSLLMTLHDIGFDNSAIQEYMALEAQGSGTEAQRRAMLDSRRSASLEEIHFRERQLDCIDSLRRKMEKRPR